LELLKTKQKNICLYLYNFCTDSVVTYTSIDKILCLNSISGPELTILWKKMFKGKKKLSYISINLSYNIKVY